MSSEDSSAPIKKSEFYGFIQIKDFDKSHGLLNDLRANSIEESSQQNLCEIISSNNIPVDEAEISQKSSSILHELSNSCWDDTSFQSNRNAFNVLHRPPIVIDAQVEGSSPTRRKLVYAPISPVQQTNTPLKIINPEPSLHNSDKESIVLKHDEIYNTYSKNRGRWDIQRSLDKTEQLLGRYYMNMLTYRDTDCPEYKKEDKVLDMSIEILENTDQTPKSATISKVESFSNESTPRKSNDSSSITIATVKISPQFLSMENSNNATDNSIKILEKFNLRSDLCHDFSGPLSFENKIPKDKSRHKQQISDALNSDSPSCSWMRPDLENSLCAPASPCLFSPDNSGDENIESDHNPAILNKIPEEDDERCRLKLKDIRLLKRLQKTLSGVLPPPSVTITQLDLTQMLDLYKTNLASYHWTSQQLIPNKTTPTRDMIENNSSSSALPDFHSWNNLSEGFNTTKFAEKSYSTISSPKDNSSTSVSNSLLISCTLNDVLKAHWPEIVECRYHGVHYNRSSISEEFELLCMKFGERYVGAETQTSCTLGNRPYSKKNTISRYPQSPGRRLSHLARRRQTFSSANLQAGCGLETKIHKPIFSARQIMLSTKRTDNNRKRYRPVPTRRTPGRKTPCKKTPGKNIPGRKTPGKKTPGRKTPGKGTPRRKTPGKATPSTSAKKRRLASRRIVPEEQDSSSTCSTSSLKPTRESSKRALFQSPPQVYDERLELYESIASTTKFDKVQKPRRALSFSSPPKQDDKTSFNSKKRVNLNSANETCNTRVGILSPFKESSKTDSRKRKFSEITESSSQDSPKSKFPRSLSFNPETTATGGKVLTRRTSENLSSSRQTELSDVHRKKLLWAVAEALRSQNIGMSHPQFKSYAAILARLTRKLLSECTEHVKSTSEKMLRLAKLHVFSVIKGKTVEEIMIEEHIRKAKAASAKVSGYVPLSEYEQSKISALNKRLVKPIIKDQPVNIVREHTLHSNSNDFPANHYFNSESDSNHSLPKPVLQDKSLNLENNLINPKIKARRQICFDDCAKR